MYLQGSIAVGDRVRVKSSLSEPSTRWGAVKAGSVGVVVSVNGTKCKVDFPEQTDWSGVIDEMERCLASVSFKMCLLP